MAMAMATTAIDDHAIHREGYAKSIRASSFAVVSGHQFLSGLNEASQPVFALLAVPPVSVRLRKWVMPRNVQGFRWRPGAAAPGALRKQLHREGKTGLCDYTFSRGVQS